MGKEPYGHMAQAVSPKRRGPGAPREEHSPASPERRERSMAAPRSQARLVEDLRRANEQLKQRLREVYVDEADQRYLGI